MEKTKYFWESKKNRNHANGIPESFRMLIVGKSGSGKTAIMLRMLLEPGLLDYSKLFVFGRSLHQPEYKIVKAGFDSKLSKNHIINILKHNILINELDDNPENVAEVLGVELDDEDKGDISCEFYENGTEVSDPKEFNLLDKNLIVFDDIMCDKNQSPADNLYTRGRHNNIDCIYILQNYYRLPRQTIRTNANFMIFFNLSKRDVDNVYYDSDASVDFKDIDDFRKFCNESWKTPYGYIIIDKDNPNLKHRYRNQLELNETEMQIPKVEEVKIVEEKQRAKKKCQACNMELLSSSHARHIKSKAHFKKLL